MAGRQFVFQSLEQWSNDMVVEQFIANDNSRWKGWYDSLPR